ncbi:MAG: STAS domain-containing protein [Thermodesulfobacteriota bacterium]
MDIATRNEGDILVATPQGKRIDASNAILVKGTMVDCVNNGSRRIVLDFQRVEFIDSSGLGVLVSLLKTLGNDGELVLCNVPPKVMSLFELTRMTRIFRIFPSLDEALRGFAG